MTTVKEVNGTTCIMRPDGQLVQILTTLVFRITKDEKGKTISLADEKLGAMFVIPLEPVEDLL
jgi:hypothetical protein